MRYRLVYCLVMIFLLTACGSENTSHTQTEKASPKEVSVETGNGPMPKISLPCGGMTKTVAAEILEVATEQVQYRFSEELNTCSYGVGIGKSINYAVYAEPDALTAEAEMTKVVDGLKFLVKCESVAGIGDTAVYCNGDKAERFLMRKGSVWVDVRTPGGLDAKTRVAKQVLK